MTNEVKGVEEEFVQSERYWRELERLDPGNGFVDAALDICRFGNGLYPEEDMLDRADPLEVYRRWREFETYLGRKDYRGNAVIWQIKEHVFLKSIGLEHRGPALRESFERHGIELLDLLMEIGKWTLGAEEIRTVRMRDPSRGGGAFFLKCSKVYFRTGNAPAPGASSLKPSGTRLISSNSAISPIPTSSTTLSTVAPEQPCDENGRERGLVDQSSP